MDKSYDPKKYENSIYQAWVDKKMGLFNQIKPELQRELRKPDSVMVWELNFRDGEIINQILSGQKTIETRTLNPDEPDRFFGEIKPLDIVVLHDQKNKRRYFFEVQKAEIYTDLRDAFNKNLEFNQVFPALNESTDFETIESSYIGLLGSEYNRKIQENGLTAIYLGRQLDPKHSDLDWEELLKKPKMTSFVMPPPNLTGSLHLGHVMEHSIYDTYLRYNMMQSKPSVFLPGVDHAGIQFEAGIEKQLKKEGLSKEEVGYDNFIQRSWDFATSSKDNIKQIAGSIGELPAWDKMHFTMDDASVAAVRGAFFDYWMNGWVYKGTRMVNWSVGLQTAVSEVFGDIEWEERVDPFVTFEYKHPNIQADHLINNGEKLSETEKEVLNYILNEYSTKLKSIKVSTVRIETIFGDVGLAIHPEVFSKQIGLTGEKLDILIGWINSEKAEERIDLFYDIRDLGVEFVKLIITDKVDKNFGSGCLKITPAHDTFDFEIFKEFEFQFIDRVIAAQPSKKIELMPCCLGRDGKLTDVCGEYAGFTVEEARPRIIKRLIETGYIPNKVKLEAEKA